MGYCIDAFQNLDFAEAFVHVLNDEGWSIVSHRFELQVR
jgi:hypothetical protein